MSWKASAYVKEIIRGISQTEKLVLFVLADYHHTKHQAAWPSVKTLAEECMMTERGIFKILSGLKVKGIIQVRNDSGRRNEYIFPALDTPEQGSSLPLNQKANTPEQTPEPWGHAIRKEPVIERENGENHITRFKPPSIGEVIAYCQERFNSVDPEKWFAYYESNGWRVGRNPMKDWKAAIRTWERNGDNGNGRDKKSADDIRRDNTRRALAESVRRYSGADAGPSAKPDGVQRTDSERERLLDGKAMQLSLRTN